LLNTLYGVLPIMGLKEETDALLLVQYSQ
jgi:hypothetical protein